VGNFQFQSLPQISHGTNKKKHDKMDVCLLGISAFLSAYVPRFLFDSKLEQGTLFLALGLSLSLFCLTLLEVMPKSGLILLSTDAGLRLAYRILLSTLSVHIVVVLPCFAGASMAESFGDFVLPIFGVTSMSSCMDQDDRKNTLLINWRKIPWWIRFLVGLLQIIARSLYRAVCYFAGRRPRYISESTSELIFTVHDDKDHLLHGTLSSDKIDVSLAPSPQPIRRSSSIVSLSSPLSDNTMLPIRPRERNNFLIALGSLTSILASLAFLSTMGPMVVQPPAESDTSTLSRVISWLCAVGLLISSLLNGFGSVSLPFAYLSGIFLKPVRPETVTKMSSELRCMQEALVKKRMTLKELTVEITTSVPTSTNKNGRMSITSLSTKSFTKSNMSAGSAFSDIKEDIKNRRQILQTEIDFLEDLVRETTMDIEELKHSQSVAAAARTNTGRAKSWIGLVFSVVLLVRLFNAGFSIWTNRTDVHSDQPMYKIARNDVVTTTLLWLTGRKYISHKRYMMLSQTVSLGLTAILSYSQVRMFLRTVTVINRRLSTFLKKCCCGSAVGTATNFSISPSHDIAVSFHSQVIAAFLGCYSVACIVLIKMMLPAKFSESFSAALGETDIFTIHAAMVNLVFFSSAVVSTSVLGMLLGIQRQNNLRHAATTNDKIYYGPDV
jgi:hypothetical protein